MNETILQCHKIDEADYKKLNTKTSEFLHRTFGDVTKNNNLESMNNMSICVQNDQDKKPEPYWSGYKKFTLRLIDQDSIDSIAVETPTEIPETTSEQIEVNETRENRNRACKGVLYQQFMSETLIKRQIRKPRPKKIINTKKTIAKPRKGKKCDTKKEIIQATEINSVPIQTQQEIKISAEATVLNNLKERSDEIAEENKRKLIPEDVGKNLNSTSIMVLPKKRFRTIENDNKCEVYDEPKTTSEEGSTILSSLELTTSNTSTHVHYKKRVSRTFAESQNNLINSNLLNSDVNLHTLADVALRGIPF